MKKILLTLALALISTAYGEMPDTQNDILEKYMQSIMRMKQTLSDALYIEHLERVLQQSDTQIKKLSQECSNTKKVAICNQYLKEEKSYQDALDRLILLKYGTTLETMRTVNIFSFMQK